MFTCPEKDIHSVYLDNELPAEYLSEYESHLKSCSKCRNEFIQMKKIHDVLQKDSLSLNIDDHLMEQSFNRLQSRMSYSKITERTTPTIFPIFKRVIPIAAAAAVIGLILPLRMTTAPQAPVAVKEFTPVQRMSLLPLTKKSVIVDGTIAHTTLTALFRNGEKTEIPAYSSPLVQNADFMPESRSTPAKTSDFLTSIDIFRPEFETEGSIPLRVTVPGPGTLSTQTQFMLPITYFAGSER
ncbi:MAG: zf-HC2 domain-containing protein [Treponema sp.]|jgi:hypothetical protein|nr:zf-HC2 domain-containing protein [Treponema sp.]